MDMERLHVYYINFNFSRPEVPGLNYSIRA
jgi:hypothetical protein